jgi:ElaB/YqjD/DUF883 family membrane-anchored ribosome-binding protein
MSNENQDTSAPEQSASEQAAKIGRTAEELAAEAVRLAKLELEKAQKLYEDVRRKAAEKIEDVREKKVGELVDCTLEAVKKYPGASLAVSVALGFCMGRWLQKLLGR